MKIGYNKLIGILLFFAGVFSCCYLAALTRIKDSSIPTVIAPLFLISMIFGIVFLFGTYIDIKPSEITVNKALGLIKNTYEYDQGKRIIIKDSKLEIEFSGNKYYINIALWMVNRSDWRKFIKSQIESKFTAEYQTKIETINNEINSLHQDIRSLSSQLPKMSSAPIIIILFLLFVGYFALAFIPDYWYLILLFEILLIVSLIVIIIIRNKKFKERNKLIIDEINQMENRISTLVKEYDNNIS